MSRYGQNNDYICRNCNGNIATIAPHRESNGNHMRDSLDGNDRDFAYGTSVTNSTETDPDITIRNYEDKEEFQPQNTRKITELDDYLPPPPPLPDEEEEYHHQNSKILNIYLFPFSLSKMKEKEEFVIN